MRWRTYVCPKCGAVKTIYAERHQSTREFEEEVPDSVPCLAKGCDGEAVP